MSKKTKIVIAALGVLVLLGGGYYWSLNRKKSDSSSSQYTPPPILGNLESRQLVKIEVPGITLEKRGEVWELSHFEGAIPPAGIELDQGQIQSMTYSLASVWTERLIEEEPEDLSVFGLDEPSARISVTDSAGRKAEYILGDMTPSRSGYYIMEEGNPSVYSVASYMAGTMSFNLDSIRRKDLLSYIEPAELTRLIIESPAYRMIDISRMPESRPLYLESTFSSHILTSPYLLPRGASGETLDNLFKALQALTVDGFVDDNPSSLGPYGLDNAVRFFLQGENGSLDLLIGNEVNGKHYAKLGGAPGVFTVTGAEAIVNATPFSLVDKFALLVNIQKVERFTVSGGGRNLNVELDDRGEESVFFLDGKRAEDKSFRQFYQAVIGLLIDAEYPQAANPDPALRLESGENITIEYQFNTSSGGRASITLVPYNRDFYVLRQEGTMEFLISRNQVRRIYETADSLVFQE